MADVNIYECDSLILTPKLKPNTGDQKACKKKNLPWLFGADRKSVPQDHCLASRSDPWMEFSICTAHP